MSTRLALVRSLHDQRRWFRAKILTEARALPNDALRRAVPMGPGSLFATLVHCWGAETAWINAVENTDPAMQLPGADAFPSLDALLAAWATTDARWNAYFDRLAALAASGNNAELDRELDRPVVRIRDGRHYTTSTEDVLVHVCTHQAYHAAQMKNMLRQLGTEPKDLPTSDYIMFARERWDASHKA